MEERKTKQSTIDAIDKYNKKTMKPISFRLHRINDKQVIDKLESVPNKADYIRQLILADISK